MNCAKIELIEIQFGGGGQTRVGPRGTTGTIYGQQLANTIERSLLAGDVTTIWQFSVVVASFVA